MMKNRNIIKEKLANDLINGKIEDFELLDNGCQFKIVSDDNDEDSNELAKAWQMSFDHLRDIGAIGSSTIATNEVFDEAKQRKIIEEHVDCVNEFVEKGEDLLFCDNLYAKLSDEEYDNKKMVYIFQKENQSISDEELKAHIDEFRDIIDNNDAVIWLSKQVMRYPKKHRLTSIINKKHRNSEEGVICPKKTALLFEDWMRYDNDLNVGYDDIICSFDKIEDDDVFFVRLNKKFIERVNDISKA